MNLPNTRLTGPAPRVAKASNPNTEKSLSADSVRPNTELKILSIINIKAVTVVCSNSDYIRY